MDLDLTSRLRNALEKLRDECAYDDSRVGGVDYYITVSKLAPGVGKKTISDLKVHGLIESGVIKRTGETGFRITALGLEVLSRPSPKRQRNPPRLKQLPPRLPSLPSRFKRGTDR